MLRRLVFNVLLGLLVAITAQAADDTSEQPPLSFHRDIRPLFQANCHGCHQPAKPQGNYVMTSFAALVAGGESGSAAIVAGNPAESYLVEQLALVDGQAEMPKGGPPLHETEIELIRRWINEGAENDSPGSDRPQFNAEHPPAYSRPPVITSLDHSPDGSLLAVAGFNEVLLHHADGSGLVARLIGLSERIEAVRFSPDGSRLVVAGGIPATSGEVQIWNVAEQSLERSISVTFDTVYGASWSPDGKKVAIGSSDTTVRVFDVETGQQVFYQGSHDDLVRDTVFSTKGDHLVTVGRDMTAKLMELETERFIDNITSITPKALKGGITSVTRHPLRDEILFGGADGIPKIYKIFRTKDRKVGDDSNQLWELPPLEGRIFSVDISADSKRIAAGSSLNGRGMVRVFEMPVAPEIPADIVEILERPTHSRSEDGVQKLKDHFRQGVNDLASVTFESGGIFSVSFHPDGSQVAAAGRDGTVRLINAESGEVVKEFVPVEIESGTADAAVEDEIVDADLPSREGLDSETIPAEATITRLSIQPEHLHIRGRHEYVQIVVSAELDTGDVVDVTRIVDLQVSGNTAEVSTLGRVWPRQDGDAQLTAAVGPISAKAVVRVSGHDERPLPDFIRDVNPVLSRTGCSAGTCHGSQAGKGGFKLSLRGYDPLFDTRALADDLAARRVNLASPTQSLMLLKSTAAVPHEGGQVLKPGSSYYSIVSGWIAAGAKLNPDTAKVAEVKVYPENPVVQKIGGRQQMRVVAFYPDGYQRDVTSEAFIESGNTDVAQPISGYPGLIEVSRRGEAPLLVRYEGSYAATTITVMGDRQGFVWDEPPKNNRVDELVARKLQRTKTMPSPLCDDYDFLRRVRLDLTGLPPTVEQIQEFVGDSRDSRWKRDRLIETLIGSPEYVEHWTNKWCDLLQVNGKFIGREGATAMRAWVRDHVENNTPYDQFARAVINADGSNREHPEASYYKILRSPEDLVENTTQLFLATRFNCNKCHDHPFERWTQDQYYELAAYFSRVGLRADPAGGDKTIGGTSVEAAKPFYEIVYEKPAGEVKHQRTGSEVAPSFPFDCHFETEEGATRREQLAAWITSSDNPYFARSYVNRLWGYMTGVGIIEPIDDIRAGNPPSNPELLDWLTDECRQSGFDARHVLRLICQSRTYQSSVSTNHWNEDDSINYSHAMPRRLPAEVLLDAIYSVTGVESQFEGVPKGLRAASLPDSAIKLPDGFLGNFGRPARESACECERADDLQLGSIMALVSGPTLNDAISRSGNAIETIVNSESDDWRLVEKLFLRVLGRPASRQVVDGALEIVSHAEAENSQLQDELAKLDEELRPVIQRRIEERQVRLDQAKQEVVAREQEYAPEGERLEAGRAARIDEAQAALDAYETALPESFAKWITEQKSATRWQVLKPIEVATNQDAKLFRESDGSVFAEKRGDETVDEVFGDSDLQQLTGIRLEALPDERLPGGGPGWHDSGNFVITEFKVARADAEATEVTPIRERDMLPLELQNAQADFSQDDYAVEKAIDGNEGVSNGWAISPKFGERHTAVFEIAQPVVTTARQLIKVSLIQYYQPKKMTIGRFRIFVTDSPQPLSLGHPVEIEDLLALADEEPTAEQRQKLEEYFRQHDPELAQIQQKVVEAKQPVPEDPQLTQLQEKVKRLEQPLPEDPRLVQLRRDVELSQQQLSNRRLVAAQDIVWGLINSPAFLFNR